MASLNNGQPITQANNKYRVQHQGNFLTRNDSTVDAKLVISNSGVIRDTGANTLGIIFHPDGTSSVTTSGLPSAARNANNSVNRELFTADGTASGNLEHDVVRQIAGIHTSVSHREAILEQNRLPAQSGLGANALGPMTTISERKIFFLDTDSGKASGLADWNIFDTSGDAVGAYAGTTDTDTTPAATFSGESGIIPV